MDGNLCKYLQIAHRRLNGSNKRKLVSITQLLDTKLNTNSPFHQRFAHHEQQPPQPNFYFIQLFNVQFSLFSFPSSIHSSAPPFTAYLCPQDIAKLLSSQIQRENHYNLMPINSQYAQGELNGSSYIISYIF